MLMDVLLGNNLALKCTTMWLCMLDSAVIRLIPLLGFVCVNLPEEFL